MKWPTHNSMIVRRTEQKKERKKERRNLLNKWIGDQEEEIRNGRTDEQMKQKIKKN